jgi:sensor histidine kinase YesM
LYFFFTYFLLKLSSINKENNTEGFSVILLVLPLNSIAIFFAFAYLTTHINLDDFSIRVFIIVSIITLVTNLIVAFIHEKTVNLLHKNAELQLETQKAEINTEYYKEMENQNSLADSLVHDIKRHLNIIQSLSTQNDIAGINDYIESVQRSSRIKDIKQYSDNKLVNIIATRYAHKCLNENIDFNSDIRNVNFDFIELSDITTIIGNLLENSYEASRIADDKYVSIYIDNINEEFLRIKTVNSVVSEPEIKNGNIVSSKRNKKGHGIGLKSIKKAAQKYDGDINWTYDDQANQFTVIVLLKYSNRI